MTAGPSQHPNIPISSASGKDAVDALRHALERVRSEIAVQLQEFGWGVGSIKDTSYGPTLVLRAWPDTWSTSGPGTEEVRGETDTEAWLNAWRWAKERRASTAGGDANA